MRWLFAVLLILAACSQPTERLSAAKPIPPTKPSVLSAKPNWDMRVQGRAVKVHVVTPKSSGPWPTVMLLHGASGLGDGYMIWPVAEALAERGVAAAVVQYFDAMPNKIRRKGAVRYFEKREAQLDEMVDQLLAQRLVRGSAIGIYGYSLGGFHGLALAGTDPRVAAVVSLGGGLPRHVPSANLRQASPALVVHGKRDRIVPFSRASETVSAWKQYKRPIRMLGLPKTGHVPRGANRDRIVKASADFLARELVLQLAQMQ